MPPGKKKGEPERDRLGRLHCGEGGEARTAVSGISRKCASAHAAWPTTNWYRTRQTHPPVQTGPGLIRLRIRRTN